MRCKPFDQQTREALRKLGFAISDDGESAKIADVMTVEIIWPKHKNIWDDDELLLTIELPNGMELVCEFGATGCETRPVSKKTRRPRPHEILAGLSPALFCNGESDP
jgi:hypothetical protein